MGLPVRQRRILEQIECDLRGSDPPLMSLFAIFGRLTRDDQMPGVEQLQTRAELSRARRRGRLGAVGRRLHAMPVARQRAVLVVPIALLVAASTFLMAAVLPSPSKCTPVVVAAGAAWHGAQASKSKTCTQQVAVFGK